MFSLQEMVNNVKKGGCFPSWAHVPLYCCADLSQKLNKLGRERGKACKGRCSGPHSKDTIFGF